MTGALVLALLASAAPASAQAPTPDVEEIMDDLLRAGEKALDPSPPPKEHLIYVTVPRGKTGGVIEAVRPCGAPHPGVTGVDGSRSRLLFRIPFKQDERAMCIRRKARPYGLVVADSR